MTARDLINRVALPGILLLFATAVQAQISANPTQWQPLSIDFSGPATDELAGRSSVGGSTATANPFLDYRLDVTFTHTASQTSYTVPGFYAVDNANGDDGWRVKFTPDQPGQWSYNVDFRNGTNVAVADDPATFSTTGPHGTSGNFDVADFDEDAPGFLSKGRLSYAGGHYLRFANGEYFIKGGADSPENFLGYAGFDNTPNFKHQYAPHRNDWNPGDPNWTTTNGSGANVQDGKNIIGALNYLSSQHVNSIYFLPMNIGGDGKDTWPYASTGINTGGSSGNDNLHYDLSKLAQWETALQHAQEKGIYLHFVLNEAETPNKQELDNATLGTERKLFYRELIARFGHHNALQWNISEEYNRKLELSPDTVRSFAQFIQDLDPYDHPITVHNGNFGNWPSGTDFPDQHTDLPGPGQRAEWEPYFGDSLFSIVSYQNYNEQGIGDEVEYLRQRSALKGRPIPVSVDEPESIDALSADNVRKHQIWDIYLSGGNVEWFVRGQDQSLEDFRQFEQVWRETWYARKFLQQHFSFWQMTPDDDLLRGEDSDFGGAEVFAITGDTYAIYLPDASNDDNGNTAGEIEAGVNGPPELDLNAFAGDTFILRWYNPRTGDFVGNPVELLGGDWASLGITPDGFRDTSDWAALIRKAVPEDLNGDAFIDQIDLDLLLADWKTTGGGVTDLNGDNIVDDRDLGLLLGAWTGPGNPPLNIIPEPATGVTLLLGLLAIRRR